ncbi:MAG: DUF2789 domain-containing protein [Proteobacteria bacterium]|nr:DUF2789 domain-containing protein [Pseudomonadota bacterium]MCH8176248.1 DUF2789 domain-containing protein [Pseudomonadota bacterium]
MDLSARTLNTLFAQLGLGASDEDIDRFIGQHRIEHDRELVAAEFWTVAQVAFLREALLDDADWVVLVDQLDTRLRN